MKTLLLTLTLAGNIVLGCSALAKYGAKQRPISAGDHAATTANADATTEANATLRGLWSRWYTGDLHALVARLRKEGAPRWALRTIVVTLVREQFAPRYLEAAQPQLNRPYWKIHFGPEPTAALAQSALAREEKTLIQELLGTDYYDEDLAAKLRQRFGPLPIEKLPAAERIIDVYAGRATALQLAARGVLLPEDRRELSRLEQQRDAELAAVLTPAEFGEYELRNSRDAATLRRKLAGFRPTTDEFRALFRLMRHRSPPQAIVDTEAQPRSQALFTDDELQTIFTRDRLVEYRQATDPVHRAIYEIAARFDLPAEAVARTISIEENAATRAKAIRDAIGLEQTQRSAELQALAERTGEQLTEVLGPRGLEAYRRARRESSMPKL